MDYRVPPGLYAVGDPRPESPVLVSANYKLSFDRLRSHLSGVDAWVLVLDTQGVNVWCAAGKGTFGTDELVRRIETVHLNEVVSHRTVIVPQLAAPGVAGHEVKGRSGFRVVFGPIRAKDIPRFLGDGTQATPAMRRVRFSLWDRLVLVPVELVTTAKWTLALAVIFLLLSGVGRDGFAAGRVLEVGIPSAAMFLATCVGCLVLGPALLPWLPGRSFSLKGFWVALALLLAYFGLGWFPAALSRDWPSTLAWCLLLPAAGSTLVMKFTGASTYTSLSGVRREMRVAMPIQLACAILGLLVWLVGRFA
jgi:acetyl-CoA decarbonylase/synthase complex subunit gamma